MSATLKGAKVKKRKPSLVLYGEHSGDLRLFIKPKRKKKRPNRDSNGSV